MTKEKLLSVWEELDEAGKMAVYQFAKQDHRAAVLGLSVRFDKSSGFFIADPVTNTVIAPPPMCLEAVAEWLDDYEKEAAKE